MSDMRWKGFNSDQKTVMVLFVILFIPVFSMFYGNYAFSITQLRHYPGGLYETLGIVFGVWFFVLCLVLFLLRGSDVEVMVNEADDIRGIK